MKVITRGLVGLLLLSILSASGIALTRAGVYGWTLFVGSPVILGGLVSWIFEPRNGRRAFLLGMAAALVVLASLLLVGIEGLGCLVLALPLAVPLAGLGSWAFYDASSRRAKRGLAMILLLPPGILFDVTAVPPVYQVRTSVVIAAPPERVWRQVVSFPDLPAPREWYFHTGLAYPTRTRIEGSGPGAIRYCDFSTGPVVEPVEVWDAPRLLRFRVTSSPAPLHEWSPYANVTPKHLHGYFVSKQGEFRLTPLSGNRTLLEGTSWYQHGLWPAPYWRLWSDAIIHRIHLRVLTHIKTLAEQPW